MDPLALKDRLGLERHNVRTLRARITAKLPAETAGGWLNHYLGRTTRALAVLATYRSAESIIKSSQDRVCTRTRRFRKIAEPPIRWKGDMPDRRRAAADCLLVGGSLALTFVLSGAAAPVVLSGLVGGAVSSVAADSVETAWPRWREKLLKTPPPLSDPLHAAVVVGTERAIRDLEHRWERSEGIEVKRENKELFNCCTEAFKLLLDEARQLARTSQSADTLARVRGLVEGYTNPRALEREFSRALGCDEADLAGFIVRHIPVQMSRRVMEAIVQSEAASHTFQNLLALDSRRALDDILALLKDTVDVDEHRALTRRLANELPYESLRWFTDDETVPPLSAVYISRRLEISAAGGQRLTLEQALEDHTDDLVIVGQAGAGKSTAVRHMALLATHGDAYVPVLVPARALLSKTDPWERRLSALSNLPEQAFQRRPNPNGTWLLLVDGLDEVIEPLMRADLLDELAQHAAGGSGRWRTIATTRLPEDAERLTQLGFTVAHLAQLEPTDLSEFADRWFAARPKYQERDDSASGSLEAKAEADQAVDRFESWVLHAGMHELAGVPLFMTLAALLSERDELRAVSSRWELLRSLTDLVITEEQERSKLAHRWLTGLERELFAIDPEHGVMLAARLYKRMGDLLEQLAWWRQSGEQSPLLDVALEFLRAEGLLPEANPQKIRRIVTNLLVRTGFITTGPTGAEFAPEIIRDFLVARSLALGEGSGSGWRLAQMAAHRRDPAWREVMLLLGEALSNGAVVSRERENQLVRNVLTLMSTKRRAAAPLWDWSGWLREEALADKLLKRPALRELLPEIARSGEYDLRWRLKAIESLADSGNDEELLQIALEEQEPSIVVACARALAQRPQIAQVLPVLRAVSVDVRLGRGTRIGAARALIEADQLDDAAAALVTAGKHRGGAWSGSDPGAIASLLLELGHDEELRYLALDAELEHPPDRVGFVEALVEAHGQHDSGLLRDVATASSVPPWSIHDRLELARLLEKVGARDEARKLLLAAGLEAVGDFDAERIIEMLAEVGASTAVDELARSDEPGIHARVAAARWLTDAGGPDRSRDLVPALLHHDQAADAAEKLAQLVDAVAGAHQLLAAARDTDLHPVVAIYCACLLAERYHSADIAPLLLDLAARPTVEPRERIKVARLLVDVRQPLEARAVTDLLLADTSISPHELSQVLAVLVALGRSKRVREMAEDQRATAEVRLSAARALADVDKAEAVAVISHEVATGPLDWISLRDALDQLVELAGYEALRPIATDTNISLLRRAEAAAQLDDDAVIEQLAEEAIDQAHRLADRPDTERAIRSLYALGRSADLVEIARDPTVDVEARVSAVSWGGRLEKSGHAMTWVIEDSRCPMAVRLEAARHVDADAILTWLQAVAADATQPTPAREQAIERLSTSRDHEAFALLSRLANSDDVEPELRVAAASAMRFTAEASRVSDWLKELSESSEVEPEIKVKAIEALLWMDPKANERRLRELVHIAGDRGVPLRARSASLEAFRGAAERGDQDLTDLVTELVGIIRDPGTPEDLSRVVIESLSIDKLAPANVQYLRELATSDEQDASVRTAAIGELERLRGHWLREVRLEARTALGAAMREMPADLAR